MTLRKPFGVVLIVVYVAIVSSISLVSVAGTLLVVAVPPYIPAYLLLPVIGYVTCVGLWRLQKWGYWLCVFYFGIGLLAGVYFAAFGGMEVRYSVVGVAQWAIAVAILVYLAMPGVRKLFLDAGDSWPPVRGKL